MAEIEQDIVADDPIPKPKLADQHRAKLDSIVSQMIANKESEDAIHAVVSDYKNKYSSNEIEQPKAFEVKISNPSFKSTPVATPVRNFTGGQEINSSGQFSAETGKDEYGLLKLQGKAREAQTHLTNELHGNDTEYDKKVREYRRDSYDIEKLKNEYKQNGWLLPVESELPNILTKAKQRQYDLPVTKTDISDAKTGTILNTEGSRKFIKDLNNTTVQKNAYLVDAYNHASQDIDGQQRVSKIDKNSRQIENGELVYDPVHRALLKPEGFVGSLLQGRKELNKLYDDYDFFKNTTNDAAVIKQLNADMITDVDEPISVPKGVTGEVGKMIGGQPIKGMLVGGAAAIATTALGHPEQASTAFNIANAGLSAHDMYKIGYASALRNNYIALKRQNPEKADSEILQNARSLAEDQANTDAATGAVMSLAAGKMAFKPTSLTMNSLKKGIGSALTQIGEVGAKKTLEGLGVGGLGSIGQIIKNKQAQAAGLPVESTEGVKDAMYGGALLTVATHLIASAPKALKPSTFNKIAHALTKIPEDVVQEHITSQQQEGYLTSDQADYVTKEIQNQRKLDEQIPENIPEPDRLKVQEKIKERDALEAKLETVHKAYHPEIKEQIKKLDEDIINISKGSERGELQSLVNKEHDADKIEGNTGDVLKNATEKELNTYFKDISEQAHDPATEQATIDTFGDKIVSKAKELFPQKDTAIGIKDKTNIKEVLSHIASTGNEYSDIAKEILPIADAESLNVPVNVNHELKPFLESRAQYDHMGDHIEISSDYVNDPKILTHEILHGLSQKKMPTISYEINGKEYRAQLEDTVKNYPEPVKNLVDLYFKTADSLGQSERLFSENGDANNPKKGSSWGTDPSSYALTNIHEFIAEAFSNKEFQKKLKSISLSTTETAWDRFINAIKKMAGISVKDDLFGKVMEAGKDIIKLQREQEDIVSEPVAKKGVSVIQPGEIKQPETITIAPREQPAEVSIKPELETPTSSTEGQAENPRTTGITHAQTDEIAKSLGFDTYDKDPETVALWDKQARERFAKDPNALDNLMQKLRNGEGVDKVETRMMLMHMGDLMAKYEKNPTPGLLNEIKRTKSLFDISGREKGKELAARRGSVPVEESLADYHLTDIDYNKGAPLTEEQTAKSTKEYHEIKAAKDAFEENVAKKKAERMKLKAEKEVEALSKKAKTDNKKDYKQERKDILDGITKKWNDSKGQLSATFIPYADRLVKIAPDVMKLVANVVAEGVEKLPDVIKAVHKQIKALIPDITEGDVHDIIAGEYNKKQTRTQLAEQLYNLRQEARLMNELEQLQNGEIPTSEKRLIKRNQRIDELRQQIKGLKDEMGLNDRSEAEKLSSLKGRYKSKIKELEEKIAKGDYKPEAKREPIALDKEGKDLRDKYLELKEERVLRLLKQEYGSRSSLEKGVGVVSKTLKTGRTLQSSFDVSYPYRQTLPGLARQLLALPFTKKGGTWSFDNFKSQKALADQFGKMYRSFGSEKVFRAIMDDIHNDPRYEMWKEAGLDFADPISNLESAKEEMFQSSYADKIPGVKIGVKASHRAATSIANKMKWDIVNELADKFKDDGKTFANSPDLYKATAKYANQLVGRGILGEKLQNAAPVIAHFVYSLRLYAAKLQLLTNFANPVFYMKVPKEIRVEYFKDMTKFLALGGTILSLSAAAGLKVGLNPYNSDFGSITAGDTKYDIWGGSKQYVVLLARLLFGKANANSDLKQLFSEQDGGFKQKSRGDILLRFARTKASPELGAIIDIATGTSFDNKKVTAKSATANYFTPLLYKDVTDALHSPNGGVLQALMTFVLAAHGVGTQTYGPKDNASSGGTGATGKVSKTSKTTKTSKTNK
jgi:hypothetical protein